MRLGLGASSRATEAAIATTIMASGRVSATANQGIDSRDKEKPASSSRNWPNLMVSSTAAMLGPKIAMTLRTPPVVVVMGSAAAARPSQRVQEIANVTTKNAASWCRRTTKAADDRSLTIPLRLRWRP